MRYVFKINMNQVYVYKGVFLLVWLTLVIHGDNSANQLWDIPV